MIAPVWLAFFSGCLMGAAVCCWLLLLLAELVQEHRGDGPSLPSNLAVARPRPASARAVPELNRGVSAEVIANGPLYWGDDIPEYLPLSSPRCQHPADKLENVSVAAPGAICSVCGEYLNLRKEEVV